jgi:hypothetical protein
MAEGVHQVADTYNDCSERGLCKWEGCVRERGLCK